MELNLEDLKDVATYLNASNVSYKLFPAEHILISIQICLQGQTLDFFVDTEFMLYAKNKFNNLGQGRVNFSVSSDQFIIAVLSKYITRLAKNKLIMYDVVTLRQTSKDVHNTYKTLYYDDFLDMLHAASYIEINHVDHMVGTTTITTVYVI
jgi:hypothetical protein